MSEPKADRTWLTIPEVAKKSGRTELTVRREIYRGRLKAHRPGKTAKYRIELRDFSKWFGGWGSIPQASERSGISESTIRRHIFSGNLPAHRPGGTAKYRIEISDFNEWLNSR